MVILSDTGMSGHVTAQDLRFRRVLPYEGAAIKTHKSVQFSSVMVYFRKDMMGSQWLKYSCLQQQKQ